MAHTIVADLDTMVFEDRERRYGAYVLRKRYPQSLMIGTFLVLLLAAVGTFGPLLYHIWFPQEVITARTITVIGAPVLPPPPPISEEDPLPIEPPPPTPPPAKTVAFNIPTPVPEDQVEDSVSINDLEVLKKAPRIDVFEQEGEEDIPFTGLVEEEIPKVIVEQNEPGVGTFVHVDEEPSPININDIKKLIGYPQMARDAGIDGQVIVRVLVDKKGSYKKHKVINGVHPILSRAVEDQLHRLRFTPAIQGGKPIAFWVNIPFRFEVLN